MKILHWNIEAGGYGSYQSKDKYPKNMEMIVKAIKSVGADFVNLVDVYRWGSAYSSDQLRQMFGYKNVFWTELDDQALGIFKGQLGVMAMTNLPVKKFEKIRAGDRNFIKTALKLRRTELDVFTIHLNHLTEEKRIKETKALLEFVKNVPTIVVGDFNTIDEEDLEKTKKVTENPIIKLGSMVKGSRGIIRGMYPASITKLLKQAGLTDWGAGKGNTFPTLKIPLILNGPAARLDYVFGSRDINVVDFKVLNNKQFGKLSDHYPILVDLEMM